MSHAIDNLINLEEMALFVKVVEQGSFTSAADHFDIPKSTISRRIRLLEDQLGARLLNRTTRSQTLTELGEIFYQRCLPILEQVLSTQQLISSKQQALSGRLRIYAPTDFYGIHFQDLLIKFTKAYPDIQLELLSGAGQFNMLDYKVDLMLYVDTPQNSSYVAQKISECSVNYYASVKYIKKYGEPKSPEELSQHKCIMETPNPGSVTSQWIFNKRDKKISLDITPHHCSDSSQLCARMVEKGLGISLLPDFICKKSVASGRLKVLFKNQHKHAHAFYAIYSSRRHTPEKVKVFLDFLKKNIHETLE